MLLNSLAWKDRAMSNIVLATDFSDNSLHAAAYAVGLLGATGHRYTILHTYSVAYPTVPLMMPELRRAAEERSGEFTDRFIRRTGAEGVEQEVHFGSLPAVVNDLAQEKGAQLVVVGNSGKTGSTPFGSTALAIIKSSRIPVLAVPVQASLKRAERILLADDHGELLPHHLEILRSIATINRSEVLVVHEGVPIDGSERAWRSGTYGYSLRDIGHSFHEVRGNDVVDGLERLARAKHVDIVAVVHRHIGAISRLFHPSTAKELARHAERPLLVLQDVD